jgi:predicted RNase H-like HicB family nuclease
MHSAVPGRAGPNVQGDSVHGRAGLGTLNGYARRMTVHYHINIFYSEEDNGYIADIPDLDACSAFDETPEQALAELERAKSAWLDAARAAGQFVPPPRYRPLIYQVGH